MATTKKSTKAKTKKPVRQTKTKSAAQAVKPVQISTNNKSNTLLTRLNLLSVIVSIGLAGLAGLFMDTTKFELVKGSLAKNELAREGVTSLVPAVHHIYDLELRYAVIFILLVSAVLPIMHLTRYKARYADSLKSKVNLWRWIDMAVVSALIMEIIALLSGVADIFTLKVIAGLMVVTCMLGWVAEKRNKQAGRAVWSEAVISFVTGILPWTLIGGYALMTWIDGRTHSPWYVYALYAVVLPGFIGYSVVLISAIKRRVTDYQVIERSYLALGIIVKASFAAILISGLR